MSISDNLSRVKKTIPEGVCLIAVSKTYPFSAIVEAYDAGQRFFGESRPQELVQKQQQLPRDINWHFIGHLQTNKVKYIVPFAHLIHSVDSVKLFNEINKEAAKIGQTANCLLQVHIADEDTKFGFLPDELELFLASEEYKSASNIQICGLMGMASYTSNTEQVHSEFRGLKQLFLRVKESFFHNNAEFKELSMGMSGDYPIAIDEGATMVRVGTSIFGEREYNK